jgi:hypothetical protein
LGLLRYYGNVIRVAFFHSLGLAQAVVFALLILAGTIAWAFPGIKMPIDVF